MRMSQVKICLFGKFRLLHANHELDGLQSAKAKELFCYLLLHRDRPHSREILANVLWSECSAAQSRKYFRQTLWQLQQAFNYFSHDDQFRPLQVDGEYLGLNSEAESCLDIAIFEKAFAPVRGIAGEEMDGEQANALRNAVSLYTADLLEGYFQDWCLYHRERLHNMYLAILDKLMAYCEFHQDYENGLSFGERLLLQDIARERTYFKLMRLHYLAGDRAGALRQFHRCVTALEAELGVKPAKRTLELYEEIRTDQLKAVTLAPAEANLSSAAKIAPLSFFPRLRGLRSVLLKLQHRVGKDIQEIDHVLGMFENQPRCRRHSRAGDQERLTSSPE